MDLKKGSKQYCVDANEWTQRLVEELLAYYQKNNTPDVSYSDIFLYAIQQLYAKELSKVTLESSIEMNEADKAGNK